MSLKAESDREDDTESYVLTETSASEGDFSEKSESSTEEVVENDKTPTDKTSVNMLLTEENLRNGAWLTDTMINEFLLRLKFYFDSQNTAYFGLDDPIALAALRINNENMRAENFVQIVNSSRNHWVCVAGGLDFIDQDICLFDSMTRSSIDRQLGTTCSLLVVPERLVKGNLIFKIQKVGKQRGSFCGYYALANAMALCIGLDPEGLIFDETQLREHFINIIYHNQQMSMFPYKLKARINKTAPKYLIFDLRDVELTDRQYFLD